MKKKQQKLFMIQSNNNVHVQIIICWTFAPSQVQCIFNVFPCVEYAPTTKTHPNSELQND